ncbi:MAG: hypothetical protein GY772_09630 [bacterium]|nr:hypothetical protein [bacterium]
MQAHLAGAGLHVVSNMCEAHCHFVQDIAAPGEKAAFLAGFLGQVIASQSIACGLGGNFVTYRAAATKRVLYVMSDAFRTKHAAFARTLDLACAEDVSAWRRVATPGDLAKVHARMTTVIVALKAETETMEALVEGFPKPRSRHHVFTKPELLKFVQKVDFTATGHCTA